MEKIGNFSVPHPAASTRYTSMPPIRLANGWGKRQDTYLWWCQPRTHGMRGQSSQRKRGHVIGVVPSKLEETAK